MSDFLQKDRLIWDKLENFKLDLVCSCNTKCSFEVVSLIVQTKNKDCAIQGLRGLNDQYSNVRYHVLLMDTIPYISKIFSYFAQ